MGRKTLYGLPKHGAPTSGRSGIYAIMNTVNGKQYVGQTVDLEKRRRSHRKDLDNGKHHNQHLQSAYSLYGKTSFSFIVLEYVSDRKQLNEREKHWIDIAWEGAGIYNVVLDPDNWLDYVSPGVKADAIERGYLPDSHDRRPAWHAWVYGHAKNPVTQPNFRGYK